MADRYCDRTSKMVLWSLGSNYTEWVNVYLSVVTQGDGADVARTTRYCTTLPKVVIYRCCQHVTPTHAQVRIYGLDRRSVFPSVYGRRSCLPCCWSPNVEQFT